ncbi:leucine-rich repeat domain-containing protein [bacterium]|nr:leucine-rich repeat domain-containing protein [bacterium]
MLLIITIPASVKAITGYQAAVVYETASGNIVNPTFDSTNGVVVGSDQTLLPLNGVGAFQQVKVTNGSDDTSRAATLPTIAATGLSTLTTIQFENNSQLQTIGPKAFLGCSNLTTVNLPNSTNTIGAQAFQNCTNLQTINLKGVSYIGDAAFNNAFIAQNDALATQNPVVLDLTSAQYIGTGAFDSSK